MNEPAKPSVDPAALSALRSAAGAVHDELAYGATLLGREEGGRLDGAAKRLADSVLRPLDGLLTDDGTPATEAPTLRELAVQATNLRAAEGAPPGLIEATAALQDLAVAFAETGEPDDSDATLAELGEIQAGLDAEIRASPNGPYLVTNAESLSDWLGCAVDVRPQMALCRCGRSETKPFCDGSHARVGFTDEKSPDRVPDRRDAYVGQQVTILDNRGICQQTKTLTL